MRLTKPGVALSIIGLSAFGGFFALQYFDSHKTPELESAKSTPPVAVVPAAQANVAHKTPEVKGAEAAPPVAKAPATQANGQNASNQLPPGIKAPPVPPEVEKLNAIQKELVTLSAEELEKEVVTLKAKLNQNDLLKRMKEEKLEGTEKDEAKQMLIRLALLNVEKAKRGASAKKPPLAEAHAGANEHEHVE